MKKLPIFLTLFLLFVTPIIIQAQNQEKEMTFEEMVAKEAERLQKILKLEDHQLFWVDSILLHDMGKMQEEANDLKKKGMQEYSSYKAVQDKWMEKIDSAYVKIFTDEQWTDYLRLVKKQKVKKEKQPKKR